MLRYMRAGEVLSVCSAIVSLVSISIAFVQSYKLISKQLKGVPEVIASMIMGEDSDDTRSVR